MLKNFLWKYGDGMYLFDAFKIWEVDVAKLLRQSHLQSNVIDWNSYIVFPWDLWFVEFNKENKNCCFSNFMGPKEFFFNKA